MYIVCIFRKSHCFQPIENLYINFNFTMYISTILTCSLKLYVIGLHNLIPMNIFFTIKDHSIPL